MVFRYVSGVIEKENQVITAAEPQVRISTLSSVRPVERYDTLADRAYEQLRQALMSGSFPPGQKLTIRKLAAVLGISATPARDAISRLLSEGVLETDANRNVSVPILDEQRLREIYILRIALEGLAAELGTPNLGNEDIAELEMIQSALTDAMDRGDYEGVLARNGEFHFRIYNASGIALLIQTIEQLWLKLGPSLNLLYPEYNRSRKGVRNHSNVLTALRARDASKVRRAIESDLREGGEELGRALSNAQLG